MVKCHKADGVDEALQDVKDTDIISIAENIQESEDLLDSNKAPVIKLVNMLLFQALKLRASDIHLQPYGDRLQVRMRIDGVLYDMESIPRRAQEAIVSRVKVMGKMDIAERRLPQDGRASIRIGDGDVDVRISSIPVSGGERIVFRILDQTTKVYTLDQIGLCQRPQPGNGHQSVASARSRRSATTSSVTARPSPDSRPSAMSARSRRAACAC